MHQPVLARSAKVPTFDGPSMGRHVSWIRASELTRLVALVLGVSLCPCLISGCASQSETATNPDGSLAKGSTDGKALTYVLTGDGPLEAGDHELVLKLLDSSGKPVDGLTVVVVPFMPAMGHGSPANPTVVPEGGGIYRLSDVMLEMSGYWLLNVEITGSVTDTVAIELDVS